jgi:hypothetical protein
LAWRLGLGEREGEGESWLRTPFKEEHEGPLYITTHLNSNDGRLKVAISQETKNPLGSRVSETLFKKYLFAKRRKVLLMPDLLLRAWLSQPPVPVADGRTKDHENYELNKIFLRALDYHDWAEEGELLTGCVPAPNRQTEGLTTCVGWGSLAMFYHVQYLHEQTDVADKSRLRLTDVEVPSTDVASTDVAKT